MTDKEYIKCSITFSGIPESKIRSFTKKDGTEESALDLTIIKRKSPDKYGHDIAVFVSQSKEEWESKAPKIFIGNGKIFGSEY